MIMRILTSTSVYYKVSSVLVELQKLRQNKDSIVIVITVMDDK